MVDIQNTARVDKEKEPSMNQMKLSEMISKRYPKALRGAAEPLFSLPVLAIRYQFVFNLFSRGLRVALYLVDTSRIDSRTYDALVKTDPSVCRNCLPRGSLLSQLAVEIRFGCRSVRICRIVLRLQYSFQR